MRDALWYQENTYDFKLPQDVSSFLRYHGTSLHFNGIVKIARRVPEEHSELRMSDLLKDDAFYCNLWKALLSPDAIIPSKRKLNRAGMLVDDNYIFFKENFCRDNAINTSGFEILQDVQADRLKLIVNFASKRYNRDAMTITYFLTSYPIPTRY